MSVAKGVERGEGRWSLTKKADVAVESRLIIKAVRGEVQNDLKNSAPDAIVHLIVKLVSK